MFPIKYRKYFYIFSLATVVASILLMFLWGFNVGTDFRGGTIIEVKYSGAVPNKDLLENKLKNLAYGEVSVRNVGSQGFIIRTRELTLEQQDTLKNTLLVDGTYSFNIERLNSVGPTIGAELKNKAVVAIGVIILITILFIAYTFRGISKPVSSWSYGFVSIVALAHDIIIPTGAAVIFGRLIGMEIDALFVTALLSLLGYSINDTIVIFDKIRDNLKENQDHNNHEAFENVVGRSLSETYGRSINTSLTVFLVLICLYIFGGSSIHNFILTLIIGTIAGAYSSIFLAAPLLVTINNWKKKSL